MSDFDWYLSPSDRFAHETQFQKTSENDETVYLTQLDPVFKLSRLSQTEFLSIWNLIDIRSQQKLNKEQFIYFMHVLTQRRKGRQLPVGIPLSIKESFLKEDDTPSNRRMYTRPGGRFSQPKTRGDLQAQLAELKDKLETARRERTEVDDRLSSLQTTQIELQSVVDYKRRHLDALKSAPDVANPEAKQEAERVKQFLLQELRKLDDRCSQLNRRLS